MAPTNIPTPRLRGVHGAAANAPVGVFDSGMGGLSVLREIRKALPEENLLYVADSGYAPYGDRPRDFIEKRASVIADFFLVQGVKAIVAACNTVTGVAVDGLRTRCPVPVVAIEPAIKPAAGMTRSGVIGVLATRQTIASDRVSRLIARHGNGVRILLQACPGLVEQVERAELGGRKTVSLVENYVTPLLEKGADTLVLGCTHYPFLSPMIKAVAGPTITVIDPAAAVAKELRRRLNADNIASCGSRPGTERFWTSGPIDHARRIIGELWGSCPDVRSLPSSDDNEHHTG
ncbi:MULTISPECIES: glutamate racemase [Desulfococcus]|nr:glutamate racemase [Desulfococcus multivorans]AOY56835.1 MurI1: glutamate racemase [Desulfococcus multivorans]MDX9817488.1 glutamate racemase [Desulfococcus multivorans]